MQKCADVLVKYTPPSPDKEVEDTCSPVTQFKCQISSTGELVAPCCFHFESKTVAIGDTILRSTEKNEKRYVVLNINPQSTLITIERARNAYCKIAILFLILAGCWFPISYMMSMIFG